MGRNSQKSHPFENELDFDPVSSLRCGHSSEARVVASAQVTGRAPLDGEGALPVRWRKPVHMDA